jgi:hypothetical protein
MPAGCADKLMEVDREHCVRRAGGCPNGVELQKILVNQRFERYVMSERGYAAYCESSGAANKVRVGLGDAGVQVRRSESLINPVWAARDDERGPIRIRASKDKRLGNLFDQASDRVGCVGCGTRGLWQLEHLGLDVSHHESLLDASCGIGQFLGHVSS